MGWNDSRALAYLAAAHGLGFLDVLDFSSGRAVVLRATDAKRGVMEFWGNWEDDVKPDRGYWTSRQESELFRKSSGSVITVFPGGWPRQEEAQEDCEVGAAEECDTGGSSADAGIPRLARSSAFESSEFPCMLGHETCKMGGNRVWCSRCNKGWDIGELAAAHAKHLAEENAKLASALADIELAEGEDFDLEVQRLVYKDLKSRFPLLAGQLLRTH
jgi:hypothetical protein